MPGKNVLLQPGQLLFTEGDPSNGMYLVRKGDFDIFMHKDGSDVVLAKVGPGSMIGEMAFFDKKPRSASVKATTVAEVTHISNEDFSKLMKQIPRWFVGLMGTLSGRLRQTNERLQKVEAMRGRAFQGCLRVLHTLALLWHKDGVKEGKNFVLAKGPAIEQIQHMFPEEGDMAEEIIPILESNGFYDSEKSSMGIVLTTPNRSVLMKFITYLQEFTNTNTSLSCLPEEAIAILELLVSEAEETAYEQCTIPLDDIIDRLTEQNAKFSSTDWGKTLGYFKEIGEGIAVVNISNGGMGVRVTGDAAAPILAYHKVMRELVAKNLA